MRIFKDKILSYRKYYKICIFYSLLSSIILAVAGVIDILGVIDDKSLPIIIVYYSAHIILILITFKIYESASAMRDKEDELYKENVAKTNSSFLCFLFFTGFALYIIAVVIKLTTITIPLNHWLIGAAIYLLYAVYNGYALHYENCVDNAEGDWCLNLQPKWKNTERKII